MKKFNEFQSDRFLTISSIVENVVESLPNDKRSEILQEAIGNLLKRGLVGLGKWITGYDDVWGGSTGVSLNIKRSPESQQELEDYLKARVKLGNKTLPNLWGINPEKEKKARQFWGDIGNIFYRKPQETQDGPGRMEKLLGFFNLHLDLHDKDRAHRVLRHYVMRSKKKKSERDIPETETRTPTAPTPTSTSSSTTSSVPPTPPPTSTPAATPTLPTPSSTVAPESTPSTTSTLPPTTRFPADEDGAGEKSKIETPISPPEVKEPQPTPPETPVSTPKPRRKRNKTAQPTPEQPAEFEPKDLRDMHPVEREAYLASLKPDQAIAQFLHNVRLQKQGSSFIQKPPPEPVESEKIETPKEPDAAERISAVDNALKAIKGDPNQYDSPVGPLQKARKKAT